MRGDHPIISVVVPTYNRAHLLPRLFHSLLRQSESRFELIVVDDGSTDPTSCVIEKFVRLFQGRLIWVRHLSKRGCNAARNTGVCTANTDWCLFVDSDWELFEESVRIVVLYADQSPEIGAVGFMSYKFPHTVAQGYRAQVPTWETAIIPCEEAVAGRHMTGEMFWMVRRSVFCEDGIWLPEWINGMERLFGARLARCRKILAVRQVLGFFHVDPSEDHIGVHAHRKWPREFKKGYELFLAENYDILRHEIKAYRHVVLCLLHCCLRSGSYWRALVWGVRAVYWKLVLIIRPLLHNMRGSSSR